MVSEWGCGCEESRHIQNGGGEEVHGVKLGARMQRKWTTYELEVEREHDGVRLGTQMRRKQTHMN